MEAYFEFLEQLRESGVVNMFGAVPYRHRRASGQGKPRDGLQLSGCQQPFAIFTLSPPETPLSKAGGKWPPLRRGLQKIHKKFTNISRKFLTFAQIYYIVKNGKRS